MLQSAIRPSFVSAYFWSKRWLPSEKKTGLPSTHAGDLDNMGMVPDDQVRSVLNQPARLLLLRVGWPILQFVAPVDRHHNEVRQLTRQPQLLRQFDGGDLLHAAIGGPDGRHRNKSDCQLAEAKELRGAIEVQRQQPALLECCACFTSTRLPQVAGVVVLRGHQAETRLPHQLGRGVGRSKTKSVLRRAVCRVTESALEVAADQARAVKEFGKASPRACFALLDLRFHKARHHDVARKQQAKIAGRLLCRRRQHNENVAAATARRAVLPDMTGSPWK